MVDMLNSHPRVRVHSELFLQNGKGRPQWGGAKDVVFWDEFLGEMRRGKPDCDLTDTLQRYLDALFAERPGVDAIGFKLMYGQAGAWPQLVELLQGRYRARVMHLIRRNVLDIVISKTLAAERDAYHARRGDQVARATIRLDPGSLPQRLQWELDQIEKIRRHWSAGPCAYQEVFYEELGRNPSAFDALLTFLDVHADSSGLASSLQIMNPAAQSEVVENYAEVRVALEGTPYETLLDS